MRGRVGFCGSGINLRAAKRNALSAKAPVNAMCAPVRPAQVRWCGVTGNNWARDTATARCAILAASIQRAMHILQQHFKQVSTV